MMREHVTWFCWLPVVCSSPPAAPSVGPSAASLSLSCCRQSVSHNAAADIVSLFLSSCYSEPRGRTGRPLTGSQRGRCDRGRGHRHHPGPASMVPVCFLQRDESSIIEPLFLSHCSPLWDPAILRIHVSIRFSWTHLNACLFSSVFATTAASFGVWPTFELAKIKSQPLS